MKRLQFIGLALGSFLIVIAPTVAPAQDPAESVYTKPGPEHAILKREVGTWDATMNLYMGGPDAPPTSYKAVETTKLMEGGLWTIAEYRGEFLGREFVGHSMMGYDPEKKKYVASWVDNAQPRLMLLEGTYDAATNTLTMYTESKDPTGKPVKEKHTHQYKGEDQRVFRIFQPGPDGKDMLFMEVSYKKRR